MADSPAKTGTGRQLTAKQQKVLEVLRQIARDLYETDDCEIDELQPGDLSPNDIGCWVRAWVFVHGEELDGTGISLQDVINVYEATSS